MNQSWVKNLLPTIKVIFTVNALGRMVRIKDGKNDFCLTWAKI